MKESARYAKIIEWSDRDGCFVGRAPELFYGGCHGDDEKVVFEQLCQTIEDVIDAFHRNGKELPPPSPTHASS
jgi:predicted RNase H-like HicB family nuclease